MTGAPAKGFDIPRAPIAILGVPFDVVTRNEAITVIEQMIASGRPHYVVTPNVDFLVQAQTDVELRRILFEAHLVVCDGTPLVWASRLLGNPLPERVAGADLAPLLIGLAAQKGYRVFFLGASEASSAKAIARLQQEYPDLCVAGHYSPPFNQLLEMDHERIQDKVVSSRADILFVSFGCPKQEKWISMHYRTLGVPVTLGVGGTIDFMAGQVKRAPLWVQQVGAEWLFRLSQEPRRLLRRYSKDLWVFSGRFFVQWLQLGPARKLKRKLRRVLNRDQNSSDSEALNSAESEAKYHLIRLPHRLDALEARQLAQALPDLADEQSHCFLDANSVEFIDSTGIGLLIQWRKRVQAMGRHLVLVAPSRAVRRALSLLRLHDFFTVAEDVSAAHRVVIARLQEQLITRLPSTAGVGQMEQSVLLNWHGEVTAANTTQVWEKTLSILDGDATAQNWRIDFSDVRFIDSSGLGLMLRVKKLAAERGKTLNFSGLQTAVHNVIQLAGLAEFLLGSALRRRAVVRPENTVCIVK